MRKIEMLYAESDLTEEEKLDAIAEILARGYLRLLFLEEDNKSIP